MMAPKENQQRRSKRRSLEHDESITLEELAHTMPHSHPTGHTTGYGNSPENFPLDPPTSSEDEALADEATALPSPTSSEEDVLSPTYEPLLTTAYLTFPNPAKLPPWPTSMFQEIQDNEDVVSGHYSTDSWEREDSEPSDLSESRRASIELWEFDPLSRNVHSLAEELGDLASSEASPTPTNEYSGENQDNRNTFTQGLRIALDSRGTNSGGKEQGEGDFIVGAQIRPLQRQDKVDTYDGESMNLLDRFPEPPHSRPEDTGHQRTVSAEWNDFLSSWPDDLASVAEYGNEDIKISLASSPPPRPSKRQGIFDGDENLIVTRPTTKQGNFDERDGAPDPTSRFSSVEGFSEFQRGLEHVANSTEGGKATRLEPINGTELHLHSGAEGYNAHLDDYFPSIRADTPAPQSTPGSGSNKFDSYRYTGTPSVFEDDSGSEYSGRNEFEPEDVKVSREQSRLEPHEILALERETLREVLQWREGQQTAANGSKNNVNTPTPSSTSSNLGPPRSSHPEQVLGDESGSIPQRPKPELPPHLRDPESSDSQWDRFDLDLNIRDDMGRVLDGSVSKSHSGGWAEPPVEPSTDYDQLRNYYQLNGVQEDGYKRLEQLNAEIEDAHNCMEEADVRLKSIQAEGLEQLDRLKEQTIDAHQDLTNASSKLDKLVEKRYIELDRKRESGIGIAKRKVLMDLDRGRKGYLQRAPGMENSSAFGPNGKITIPSLDYAMFNPADFQPTPKIVEMLEGIKWHDKRMAKANEQLATVTEKLQAAQQEIKELNGELDELERERNEYAEIANVRTEAASGFMERLKEEREKTRKVTQHLDAEVSKVEDLQAEQEELQAALQKSRQEQEKLFSDFQGLQSSRASALGETSLTKQDIEILKEALRLTDNAIENAESDLSLRDGRLDELIRKLTKQTLEDQDDTLQIGLTSTKGEELRWCKDKIRGLERDLIWANNQKNDYAAKLAGSKAKMESMRLDSRATIQSLTSRVREADRDQAPSAVDHTPITLEKFQIDDQTFNSAIEGRNLIRELADKDKIIQQMEEQAKQLDNAAQTKNIDLQLAVARARSLEGEILWLNNNRPNPMGLPTLPTQLERLKSDAKAGQTTVPVFLADDGINYDGVEMDPVKREEKYRKLRIAKALELKRQFAHERAREKEADAALRRLGFESDEDKIEDEDFFASVFERSKPWEPESDPILPSSLPIEGGGGDELVERDGFEAAYAVHGSTSVLII